MQRRERGQRKKKWLRKKRETKGQKGALYEVLRKLRIWSEQCRMAYDHGGDSRLEAKRLNELERPFAARQLEAACNDESQQSREGEEHHSEAEEAHGEQIEQAVQRLASRRPAA